MLKNLICLLGAIVLWAGLNGAAMAEENFPNRPIRMILSSAPGGGTDMWGRTLCPIMEKELDTKIVANNMVGAGGATATIYVWNAPHDGYTWVSANDSTPAFPALTGLKESSENWSFFIAGGAPTIICANKNSGISDIQDLIEKVRSKPDSISIASSAGSVFFTQANVLGKYCSLPLKQVPIAGSRPAIISCVSGETNIVLDAAAELMDFIKSGDLIPLAMVHDYPYVVNGQEIKAITDFLPEYSRFVALRQWQGFMVPKDVPTDVQKILTDAFITAVNSKAMEEYAETRHGLLYKMHGEEAKKFAIESERMVSQILFDLGLAQHSPESLGIEK